RRTGISESSGRRYRGLLPAIERELGDARDPRRARQSCASVCEHRQTGDQRRGLAKAVDPVVLAAGPAPGLHGCWNAPLGMGSALRYTDHNPARVSDLGNSAGHATISAGTECTAGNLHRPSDGGWEVFHCAADSQDGSPGEDFGGGITEEV